MKKLLIVLTILLIGCFKIQEPIDNNDEDVLAEIDSIITTIKFVPEDYPTIQAAIDSAEYGDTILVSDGVYIENLIISSKSITIASTYLYDADTNHISNTIIESAQNDTSVIRINSSNSDIIYLVGLTITNGRLVNWNGKGAGINCNNSSLFLDGCSVKGNTSTFIGSGMYANNSHVTIDNCSIKDNDTRRGVLYFDESDVIISRSTICNNNSLLAIIIFNNSNNSLIQNTVISHNTAGGSGVVITADENVIISHCNIIDNNSDWGHYPETISGTMLIVNSILRNNIFSEIPFYSSSIVVHSNIKGGMTGIWQGIGIIDADPLFVDSENGDYNLQIGSPCIDTGIAYYNHNGVQIINIPASEYEGLGPDIGCYESPFERDYILSTLMINFPNSNTVVEEIEYGENDTITYVVELPPFDLYQFPSDYSVQDSIIVFEINHEWEHSAFTEHVIIDGYAELNKNYQTIDLDFSYYHNRLDMSTSSNSRITTEMEFHFQSLPYTELMHNNYEVQIASEELNNYLEIFDYSYVLWRNYDYGYPNYLYRNLIEHIDFVEGDTFDIKININ